MDEIASPHDRYFRESFARVEVARDFLRHNLPAAVLAGLDLATLEIATDTLCGRGPARGLVRPGLPGPLGR
jgi:hypothetical protein